MEIRLSTSDGVPVYRQIVNQVKYLVASGRLQPGQELPAIRTLAERLVINPNTVIHAYSELEREGVVVSRHGSGTYVTDTVSKQSPKAAAQALVPKVDSLLSDAAHLNLELEEVIKVMRERHAILKRPDKL
jgi:GntR family transcriptional regulator